MHRLLISCLFFFIFTLVIPSKSFAATKPKVQPKKIIKPAAPFPAGVSIKLRRDKKAVIVTFSNLKDVSALSYTLSYQTQENMEGVMGTIKPKGVRTISRELLFGTCSSGVCRYHTRISHASLEVSVTTKKGISTRIYPIKL